MANDLVENNINGFVQNELRQPYDVLGPIDGMRDNNFEGNNAENNSDNEDEAMDARINAIHAQINAAEERAQHLQEEAQAQQEPEPLM
ncbi:hypothetical protein H4R20_005766, partial [Coemansia guatemalensis]